MAKNSANGFLSYRYGGCWPNEDQLLLLNACLMPGKAAITNWEAWKKRIDLDFIDPGSYRLLPLLYRNLINSGIDSQAIKKYKGVYRLSFVKNKLHIRSLVEIIEILNKEEIDHMVLKGTALIMQYYQEIGLRPMEDVDVFIPKIKLAKAAEALQSNGWHFLSKIPLSSWKKDWHAASLKKYNQQLDLHWHMHHRFLREDYDDVFWANAKLNTIKIESVSTKSLSSTDLFFHTCIHGIEWNAIPPFRWIADILMIIKNSPKELDWDRLIYLSNYFESSLLFFEGLKFLENHFQFQVPRYVKNQFEVGTFSYREISTYKTSTQRPGILGNIPKNLSRYFHMKDKRNFLRKLFHLPRYLQYFYNLDSIIKIPKYLLKKYIWER